MRDLKSSEKNSMAIYDKLSGSGIIIYYRTPSTKERIKYKSQQVRSATTKDYESMFEQQIDWAEKIITGFSSSSFGYDEKPISSDPENENYRADWFNLLKTSASDILCDFIELVMGQTVLLIKSGGVSEDFFTKSSGNGTMPGQKKNENTI